MAKNRKKKKPQASPGTSGATKASGTGAGKVAPSGAAMTVEALRTEVERLVAEGKNKAAVDLAKNGHKQLASDASEAVLTDAYVARIRGMIEKGMIEEARSLIALVRDRHPAAADTLKSLTLDMAGHSAGYDELLRALADPKLDESERSSIEEVIRRRATDLKALAECRTLLADHPFRRAARAAWDAFVAVTSGPVDDAAIALPEIARRSPLAPWKTLIRAIASLHREDQEACERYLGAIPPDAAVAPLVPVLRALLKGGPYPTKNPRLRELAEALAGVEAELRPLFKKVDSFCARDEFYSDDAKGLEHVRRAAIACSRLGEAEARRLRLHIWIRAQMSGFHVPSLDDAFPAPILRDAAFWRLYALTLEAEDDFYGIEPLEVCAAWEEFLSHAVHEGWFPANGPEAACIYQRIYQQVKAIPEYDLDYELEEFLDDTSGFEPLYRGQPKSIVDAASPLQGKARATAYYLDADQVFARIVEADPSRENFQVWLQRSERQGSKKETEAIAERWIRAHPTDTAPILYLMERAEQRGTYKKALGYLAEAEKIDALRPEVRRARIRLNMAAFQRHFRQGKYHLASKDLDAIATVPALDGQERRAVEAALRHALAQASGNPDDAKTHQQDAARVLGDSLCAELLCWGVGVACSLDNGVPPKVKGGIFSKLPAGSHTVAMARAMALAKSADLEFPVPTAWEKKIEAELRDHGSIIPPEHLRQLADGLLDEQAMDLAFQVTRVGLAQEGPYLARFLLQRARVIPMVYPWRRGQCLAAALRIARAQRAMDVVSEVVDIAKAETSHFSPIDSREKLNMEEQHFQHVLEHERKQKKLPRPKRYRTQHEIWHYTKCHCAECEDDRLYAGRRPVAPMPDYEDDYPDYEEGSFDNAMPDWDPFGGEIPKDLEKELKELEARLRKKGKSTAAIEQEMILHMLKYLAGSSKKSKTGPFDDFDAGDQGDFFENFR